MRTFRANTLVVAELIKISNNLSKERNKMGIKKANGKFEKSTKERMPRKIKKALKKTNQTKTI